MKTIPLTRGYFTIIDDEDYERVNQFKWSVSFSDGIPYARYSYQRDGKACKVSLHHLIVGKKPRTHTDHINGNTLDNRRGNLRICTPQENIWNSRRNPGTSGYIGVSPAQRPGYWRVQIVVNRKRKSLGSFPDKCLAAAAYDRAVVRSRGAYAVTNHALGLL